MPGEKHAKKSRIRFGDRAPSHVLRSGPGTSDARTELHPGRPGSYARPQYAIYIVRFDGPVDHVQSRLEIVRNGHVVEVLHPLLDSAADVLFASASAPEPGDYVLHWSVRSVDGDGSDGMIPF